MIEQEIEELIQALEDDDEDIRWDAAFALRDIGERAVPALIQALQDDDEIVRYHAAYALRDIRTTETLKAVSDNNVR